MGLLVPFVYWTQVSQETRSQLPVMAYGMLSHSVNFLSNNLDDDVDAFLYYGQYGLADPTNVGDYSAWRAGGASRKFAFSAMVLRAFIGGGAIGWLFDPKDLRSGWDADVDMFAPPVTDYGVF